MIVTKALYELDKDRVKIRRCWTTSIDLVGSGSDVLQCDSQSRSTNYSGSLHQVRYSWYCMGLPDNYVVR